MNNWTVLGSSIWYFRSGFLLCVGPKSDTLKMFLQKQKWVEMFDVRVPRFNTHNCTRHRAVWGRTNSFLVWSTLVRGNWAQMPKIKPRVHRQLYVDCPWPRPCQQECMQASSGIWKVFRYKKIGSGISWKFFKPKCLKLNISKQGMPLRVAVLLHWKYSYRITGDHAGGHAGDREGLKPFLSMYRNRTNTQDGLSQAFSFLP